MITSGTSSHMLTLVFIPLMESRILHIREIVIIYVYFLHPVTYLLPCAPVQVTPFDRFSRFMAQNMWFREIYVLLGVKFFNICHYFSQNTQNSLFPQCKTSVGNNSGSIIDTTEQFAYSSEFSAMADQMVWLPSLSCDRSDHTHWFGI